MEATLLNSSILDQPGQTLRADLIANTKTAPERSKTPRYSLFVAESGDRLYRTACDLIKSQYRKHFGCDLQEFYPRIFCLLLHGELVGCCGYRPGDQTLFLEQYLDAEAHELISEKVARATSRSAMVEIGGFAVTNKRHALPFMIQLAPAFQKLGYEFAVATVTTKILCCLRKLGISTLYLGTADPSRLLDQTTDWGGYYQQRPVVLAGAINPAIDKMQQLLNFS